MAQLRLRRVPADADAAGGRWLRRGRSRTRTGSSTVGTFRLPFDGERARAPRRSAWPQHTTRAVRPATSVAAPRPGDRRRGARRGAGGEPCSTGDVAAAYDTARRDAGRRRPRAAPDAVARRRRRRCSACPGSCCTGRRRSSPTSARRRSCATSTWPGLPEPPAIDGTVRILGVVANPADTAAARRRGRAGSGSSRPSPMSSRRGARHARLAGAGDAAPAARGAARRLVPRAALRRPRRLHARAARACCTSRPATDASRGTPSSTATSSPACSPIRRPCGSSCSTRATARARR